LAALVAAANVDNVDSGSGKKWTPKECIRHTRERCCVITNIDADRVSYHDFPQTPPVTPISTRSLTLPIQEPPQSRGREVNVRHRSPVRLSEGWELMELPRTLKTKDRKGER
jgi:hypothetical protein